MSAADTLVHYNTRDLDPKDIFKRSPLFYFNFTSDETLKQEEFSQFVKMFRQQRKRLKCSVARVALDVRCSKTTIFCFESLKLSLRSMRKWKPLLQNWLTLATQTTQVRSGCKKKLSLSVFKLRPPALVEEWDFEF